MQPSRQRLNPDSWINLIFAAKAARTGGVVRRSVRWVEREVGHARFENEVRRRGFHLVQSGGQYIVICNTGGIRVIC
ncbi:MAG: N-(5'-phosphoribosyl)anthranilate isomerase [Marinosulfonomonas sp.]|nr:N-(5'-phosphoribosyl)anthranilate isomerase [Marinosulfonomonas sp.]